MRGFKPVLYALLVANTVYFAVAGTPSKAIDAAAWLALLLLFEAETGFARHLRTPRRRRAVGVARLLAGTGVIAALVGYFFEDNALDAINGALWIGVVVMLEAEIRFPQLVAHLRTFWRILAVVLYGGLGALVVVWAVQGMWLDAYDAVLWLIAFVAIELALVRGDGARAVPGAATRG